MNQLHDFMMCETTYIVGLCDFIVGSDSPNKVLAKLDLDIIETNVI
jgi:hypothetical protein